MREYANNPEIRRSNQVLLFIMLFFMLCSYLSIRESNRRLQKDYLSLLGGLTAKIIDVSPQLESQIVPLMTKELSKEETIRGKEILKQYGLSETLELSLFPYIKHSLNRSTNRIILTSLLLTLLLYILNYRQHSYFYRRIREFNSAAKRIVEGDYLLKLSEKKEGDLSKLAQSFNAMGEVIRGNLSALQKEKEFLVDFLSDISHQLKTPLAAMIVYNDIMLSRELTEVQRETFLINNQAQLNRMTSLIQNILKQAKLDAKAIEFSLEQQSLNETLDEAVEILQDKAIAKGVTLLLEANQNVLLLHDRLWLQESFINIIKNSIEHSDLGSPVKISLEENSAFIRITVNNKGEIIQEEDLLKVFKRFYKGKSSKKHDSFGIGLSMAKSIIERHGGYIEATSSEAEGTSFVITFIKY